MHTGLKNIWIISWTGLIIGCLPISFFLTGWWSSISRVPENKIYIYALTGLLIGIILAVLFFKATLRNLFSLPLLLLELIYVFYFICFYGFFMGFPVFNVILSIPSLKTKIPAYYTCFYAPMLVRRLYCFSLAGFKGKNYWQRNPAHVWLSISHQYPHDRVSYFSWYFIFADYALFPFNFLLLPVF